jgi:anti-anti-sigma factor
VTAAHDQESPVFECRLELADDSARLVPIGEIDIESAWIVNGYLNDVRAAGIAQVVLDLRATTFIDSTGLHLVERWHERARRERFSFGLTRGPRAVRRTFEAAGLEAGLNFVCPAP